MITQIGRNNNIALSPRDNYEVSEGESFKDTYREPNVIANRANTRGGAILKNNESNASASSFDSIKDHNLIDKSKEPYQVKLYEGTQEKKQVTKQFTSMFQQKDANSVKNDLEVKKFGILPTEWQLSKYNPSTLQKMK